MKARVMVLRRQGRRVRDGGPGIAGELRLHSILAGSEMHLVAQLLARDERGSREDQLLVPLYEPELVALGAHALLIRGFESVDGAGYVQEWRCVIRE